MSKKSENKEAAAENTFTTAGGNLVQGDVITGKDNKLTSQQQGAKARGELDENNQPIDQGDKAAEAEKASTGAGVKAIEAALTPQEKATNAKVEDRLKVLEAAGEGPVVRKAGEKLYQGWLTVTGTANTTGEEISVKYEQAEPTGEDGVYHAFRSHFPAAKREGMKIDPENKADPTKRTYLERAGRV